MAHKYADRLVSRVEAMYNHLKVPCNLQDLPPAPTRPAVIRKKMVHVRPVLAASNEIDDGDTVAIKPINAKITAYDSK